MNKTVVTFDWQNGYAKHRVLSRSFNTLKEAQRFADGKQIIDIYKHRGLYKVEWMKVTQID